MSGRAILVAAGACLALAACDDPGQPRAAGAGGTKLCTPFAGEANGQAAAAAPMDPRGMVDDCLHRWGYALAASPDPAGDVAAATVAACSSALGRWNQQALIPPGGDGPRAPTEAPSLITGEETNAVAERYGYAQGRALFYVVQARAGKCAAPPMADGALEGRRY